MVASEFQDTAPAMTVLVIDTNEDIRSALGDLLEEAGYAVAEAENLREAESLIDSSPEPMVLIVGDAEIFDHADLRFFTAVAANPVTKQAYVYLIRIPKREHLPGLVQTLAKPQEVTGDLPYELALLLAVVDDAASRL